MIGLVAVLLAAAGGTYVLSRGGSASSGAAGGAALASAGDLGVHDPALVAGSDGEPWFVYGTGDVREGFGAPRILRSDDGGVTWARAGTAWERAGDPEWVRDAESGVAGVENYWAPELYRHDGTWYLYYSASTFGSNDSAIGLATGATLDPDHPDYGWRDQGLVVRSTPGETHYNAIDPGVVEDGDGKPWLLFGSFWGGIQLLPLEWPSGKPAGGAEPVTVASRVGVPDNAIEAPFVVERDGWYHLFVSWDKCCSGVDSTYRIMVGRSREITGPYLDADGKDMVLGGGTEVVSTTGRMIGPGGQTVSVVGEPGSPSSDYYLAFHFYDGDTGGAPTLAVRELVWDGEGWPSIRVGEPG
ncbi:arabinan endo-1,5-alpha-L-arabinosidase [Myceligenerans salitolerans]|uniref:Arabinan endo-1,5-alpha-L-arabinosidase n=1 Tax=Myceligenerans salitolerans TaxID=1230528 RepID=A0ABS3IA82_9MICO|nr:arabinan endo-1,5-alpha-L-arabinosidase [Myceligenerans salitolerans]MBO0609343.1 arabinan endo-1,5-alpha-L-arabinosidase [Myceligenerans salitolerans]